MKRVLALAINGLKRAVLAVVKWAETANIPGHVDARVVEGGGVEGKACTVEQTLAHKGPFVRDGWVWDEKEQRWYRPWDLPDHEFIKVWSQARPGELARSK